MVTGAQQQKLSGQSKAPVASGKTRVAGQTYSSTAQWPVVANLMPRHRQGPSAAYSFQHDLHQEKKNEKKIQCTQDITTIQVKLNSALTCC